MPLMPSYLAQYYMCLACHFDPCRCSTNKNAWVIHFEGHIKKINGHWIWYWGARYTRTKTPAWEITHNGRTFCRQAVYFAYHYQKGSNPFTQKRLLFKRKCSEPKCVNPSHYDVSDKATRDTQIYNAWLDAKNMSQVARDFGLTRAAVSLIIKNYV